MDPMYTIFYVNFLPCVMPIKASDSHFYIDAFYTLGKGRPKNCKLDSTS